MSFVFEKPRSSIGDTFAGGTGTLGEIYAAARENMLYVDNTLASQWALDRAISERNDEVFRDTGVKLDLPFGRQRTGTAGWRSEERGDVALSNWQAKVAEAAARIPDQNVAARLNRSIEGDAIRIARESDQRLATLMASRGGAVKWVGALGGGLSGSMRDPINVLSMLVGGGGGAARTITGQIIKTAATEALINGASELAMQPMVQAWRKQAGLDNGIEAALKNAGFAAAFGGAFGAVAGAASGLAGKLSGRALETAGAIAADDARIAEPVRRAMQGDVAAARETLPEIREALPAEARGALDQAEQLDHLDASRPRSADPEIHDLNVSAAYKAIDSGEPAAFKVDQAQVARVVNDIAGAAPADASRPQSLVEFLQARGGVLDHSGELKAIGAEALSKDRKARGKPDRRVSLDSAREAAEEAGYIGRAGETQTTTVADLLDAIDGELRGQPVFSREHAGTPAAANFEAQRAGLERTVAEIAAHAGPGVDDAIIRQAAKLAIDEGMEPFDALERVLTHAEDIGRTHPLQERPVPKGMVRVYHSGQAISHGETGRWVSTNRTYASGYRSDQPLHYLDLPADDPRLVNPDYPDQGIKQGFTFNFETTAAEAKQLRQIERGDIPPGWSDAELEAASAGRGSEPQPGFFPDPGKVDPELEISPAEIKQFAELGIPSDDGRVVSLAEYMDDIKAGEDLATIVKACRA
ncbi:hypothetical protein [Mesorhizobium sp. M1399]|uniref:hypothetical protein n=1 Tax=Mesorhizobium sp. M1399 TaxID=2957096 RepID=UPI0033362521